jgi:hypothetical protein
VCIVAHPRYDYVTAKLMIDGILLSSRVTLGFNDAMLAWAVPSCVLAVAKAAVKLLFVLIREETAVLRLEAVTVARLARASLVWDWMPLKVTEERVV